MTKNDIFLLDDYSKLNSGLFDDVTKIGDDINDIGDASVEFEHIYYFYFICNIYYLFYTLNIPSNL